MMDADISKLLMTGGHMVGFDCTSFDFESYNQCLLLDIIHACR